jgi:hypothetical protein
MSTTANGRLSSSISGGCDGTLSMVSPGDDPAVDGAEHDEAAIVRHVEVPTVVADTASGTVGTVAPVDETIERKEELRS